MLDRFGRTTLHWAAEQGHQNVVLALLRAGASVDSVSARKATLMMLAAYRRHVKIVLLLDYRVGKTDYGSVNGHLRGTGDSRVTALHFAGAGGHMEVAEILLDMGFDKGQRKWVGLTPAKGICPTIAFFITGHHAASFAWRHGR